MIIANSCAGAFCYQNKKSNISYQYNNPFIGCGINADSWYNLLANFNYINFNNAKAITKFYEPYNKEINFIILDDLIEIRFMHRTELSTILREWHRRSQRLLQFLKENKYNWKDKILFVSTSYHIDNDNDLKKIAEDFPNLHQLIDIYSKEYLYDNIITSPNTILFNKQCKKMINISNYVIDHHFNYITDDYETKK